MYFRRFFEVKKSAFYYCIAKQDKYCENTKKWIKYGKKFCKHIDRFDKLQIPIDKLKEEISAKYGD